MSDSATPVSTAIHQVLSHLLRDAESGRDYDFISQGVLFDERHLGLCQEDGARAGSWSCGIGKVALTMQTWLRATPANPPAFSFLKCFRWDAENPCCFEVIPFPEIILL